MLVPAGWDRVQLVAPFPSLLLVLLRSCFPFVRVRAMDHTTVQRGGRAVRTGGDALGAPESHAIGAGRPDTYVP
jgi:hypothetical protein